MIDFGIYYSETSQYYTNTDTIEDIHKLTGIVSRQ